MPQKLQINAILEIHETLLSQKFNILLMPKEREIYFIDKIMAGVEEAIYDWSEKVNMQIIITQ